MKIEELQEKIVWIISIGFIFIMIGGLFLKHYEVRNVLFESTKCQYVTGNEFEYCIDVFSLKNDGNITGWLIKPEEDMNTVAIKVVFKQKNGKKAYIIPTTMQEREEIESQLGIKPTLINPRYITGLDEKLLNGLSENHEIVITLEDGILDGGFGQKIASFYGRSEVKVFNYGLKKEFLDQYDVKKVMEENHLRTDLIISDLKENRCI